MLKTGGGGGPTKSADSLLALERSPSHNVKRFSLSHDILYTFVRALELASPTEYLPQVQGARKKYAPTYFDYRCACSFCFRTKSADAAFRLRTASGERCRITH